MKVSQTNDLAARQSRQAARAQKLAPVLARRLTARPDANSASQVQAYAALVGMAEGVEALWSERNGPAAARTRAVFEALAQDVLTTRWTPVELSRGKLLSAMAERLAQVLADPLAAPSGTVDGELDVFVRALDQLVLPVLGQIDAGREIGGWRPLLSSTIPTPSGGSVQPAEALLLLALLPLTDDTWRLREIAQALLQRNPALAPLHFALLGQHLRSDYSPDVDAVDFTLAHQAFPIALRQLQLHLTLESPQAEDVAAAVLSGLTVFLSSHKACLNHVTGCLEAARAAGIPQPERLIRRCLERFPRLATDPPPAQLTSKTDVHFGDVLLEELAPRKLAVWDWLVRPTPPEQDRELQRGDAKAAQAFAHVRRLPGEAPPAPSTLVSPERALQAFRQLVPGLLPGFALVDRTDEFLAHWREGGHRSGGATLLANDWRDLLTTRNRELALAQVADALAGHFRAIAQVMARREK